MDRCEIRLKNESLASLRQFCFSRGLPLPPGAVRDPSGVSIEDVRGRAVPCAGKVLQRRPDGSIEWLLVDFITDLGPEEKKSVFLVLSPTPYARLKNPVSVSEDRNSVTLSNGITEVAMPRAAGPILRRLALHGKEVLGKGDRVDLQTVDPGGKVYRASLSPRWNVTIERQNRLRSTVKVEGTHAARDGSTFLDFAMRFSLTAGCPDLQIVHTFYCREAREGIIPVKAIRLVMPTRMPPDSRKLVRQAHHGHSWFPRALEIRENAEVVSSSVGDLDHYARDFKPYKMGSVFLRNFASLQEDLSQVPFHMRPGSESGFRSDYGIGGFRVLYPYLGWQSRDATLVMAFERWAQHHPKSVAIDENLLTVSFWPEWASALRLVQGVSKSHTFWLTGEPRVLDLDAVEHHFLRWEVSGFYPVDFSMDPAWPAFCQVLDCHDILRYQPEKYPTLENLIEPYPAAGNPNRFTYARHAPNGMLNFGDAGGEGGFTNNEDDVRVFVPLQDYLRTGRMYCFDVGEEAALHYLEVDFVEWSTDPRQKGGLIPHTVDHFIGNVYPSHQWSEGILAYYYLTGDERARNVVVKVGDNYCYWAENLIEVVCCDGREAGMPLVNLAAAYRLTGDAKYVTAAKKVLDHFQKKWFDRFGDLRYPYPQGAYLKHITGYGDWSSYYGLYRLWEVTGDEEIRRLFLALAEKMCHPDRFQVNDARTMDFMTVWAYLRLTGDEGVLERLKGVIPMLLRRGGHPTRRLHFLKVLDDHGLIDDSQVGNRAGMI